jgi:hypothetical protein
METGNSMFAEIREPFVKFELVSDCEMQRRDTTGCQVREEQLHDSKTVFDWHMLEDDKRVHERQTMRNRLEIQQGYVVKRCAILPGFAKHARRNVNADYGLEMLGQRNEQPAHTAAQVGRNAPWSARVQTPKISQKFGYILSSTLEESRAIGCEFLRPVFALRQYTVVWIEFSPSPPRLFRLLHMRILAF